VSEPYVRQLTAADGYVLNYRHWSASVEKPLGYGVDQSDLLFGKRESGSRDDYFYFCKGELHAVRKRKWKLILPDRKQFYGYVKDKGSRHAELYDLESDMAEKHDVAKSHPEIVKELQAHAKALTLPDTPYDERIRLNRPQPRKPKKKTSALPNSKSK